MLDSCFIRYGGSASYNTADAAVYIVGSNITVSRCEFYSNRTNIRAAGGNPIITDNTITSTGTSGYGMWLDIPTINHNVSGNSFSNGSYFFALLDPMAVEQFVLNNTFTLNLSDKYNGIQVEEGYVTSSTTWPALPSGMVYVVTGSDYTVRVEAASNPILTISPGAIVKLNAPYTTGADEERYFGIGIGAAGRLNAHGVHFTAATDDSLGGDSNGDGTATTPAAGYWSALYFGAQAGGSVLDSCFIRYGGSTSYNAADAAVYMNATDITISNVLFFKNRTGIRIVNCSPAVQYSDFLSNTTGIITTGSSPIIENNRFSGNTSYAMQNLTTTLTVDATDNWWGHSTGPRDNSTIAPDYNPGGLGDPVSDYVAYRPWLMQRQSSGTLVQAISDLDDAVRDYLNYNATLAYEVNWRAYQEYQKEENLEKKAYWKSLLETYTVGATEEVMINRLSTLCSKEFGTTADIGLFAHSLLFELIQAHTSLVLAELLQKTTGGPLSQSYFKNTVIIDGHDLTAQAAINSIVSPTIPDSLPPDFPLTSLVDEVNGITADIKAVTFCCPMGTEGKFERSGYWHVPGACNLTTIQNYTLGTDMQQAQKFYSVMDRLTDSDTWEAIQQSFCSETAMQLAFGAKILSIIPAITGGGIAISAAGEAAYSAYEGSCLLLGYNNLSLRFNSTVKLAHSLLQYNSSWPDALYQVYGLRSKIVNDVADRIYEAESTPCSSEFAITSITVPSTVCADFITQFVDVEPSIVIRNNSSTLSGNAKVFAELYLIDRSGRLNHVRTDSSNTVTLAPSASSVFSFPMRVSANGLLYEHDRYRLRFAIMTPAGILNTSRTFTCLYDYQ